MRIVHRGDWLTMRSAALTGKLSRNFTGKHWNFSDLFDHFVGDSEQPVRGVAAASYPLAARAQQSERMRRVG
jgi:hypothetical protein